MTSLQVAITRKFFRWLDVAAFAAWGILLLKYWGTGQISLLIHPNYFVLALVTGILLIAIAILKAYFLSFRPTPTVSSEQHLTLFPPRFSTTLLLAVAVLGLTIPPMVLSSDTAMKRGLSETLPVTRAQPASFRAQVRPEERSLIEWVRTLNAYPEPDAYVGQKANVKGFVVYSETLPENYLLVTRFVLTCCAVDAYPVAIPVKLAGDRSEYPVDTWIQVQGQMISETLNVRQEQTSDTEERKLVIKATEIETIPTPRNPYEY
jgi:putative membrane protein